MLITHPRGTHLLNSTTNDSPGSRHSHRPADRVEDPAVLSTGLATLAAHSLAGTRFTSSASLC